MNHLLAAVENFDDASFFCRRVKDDPRHAHHYVNAFAGATYAVWESLFMLCKSRKSTPVKCPMCGQTKRNDPSDDRAEWIVKARDGARSSDVGKYFWEGRNAHSHGGAGFVEGWSVTLSVDEEGEFHQDTEALLKDGGRATFPAASRPADACEVYLGSLVRIFAAGYEQFSTTWDPGADLRLEVERLRREWGGDVH